MRKNLLVTVLAFCAALSVTSVSACAKEQVSLDGMEAYLQGEFEKTHIPGMSVEIVSRDQVLLSAVYGACESADTPFIVGSLSKSFTAVAILQLEEQGKLDLSRPYAEYLPEEADRGGATTVKQLLNQSSGIHTYDTLENYSCAPAGYEYANVNYGLLGKIVERVSGMGYGSYLEQHIFQPLGMSHSFVSLEDAKQNGMAAGFRNYFGFMRAEDTPYPEGEIQGWLNLPSAYVISSASDMGKYLQFFLNGGQNVLSPASVERMTGETVEVQEGYQYGMGWGLDFRSGEPVWTHGGNVENYTVNMQILPERGVGIIVMFNACDYFVANRSALQLAYNTAYRLMGNETGDLDEADYWTSHLLLNFIYLALLFTAILPLLLLKRWMKKARAGTHLWGILRLALVHLALPTAILLAVTALGIPGSVVRGFAPDVFLVQIVSGGILYLTGLFKAGYLLASRRAGKTAG